MTEKSSSVSRRTAIKTSGSVLLGSVVATGSASARGGPTDVPSSSHNPARRTSDDSGDPANRVTAGNWVEYQINNTGPGQSMDLTVSAQNEWELSPSIVTVFVNNMPIRSPRVDRGPFTVSNLLIQRGHSRLRFEVDRGIVNFQSWRLWNQRDEL